MNFPVLNIMILFLYMINISADKTYNLRFRNALLRVYISSDKKKIVNEYSNKIIIKTRTEVNKYYNKLLSKYYDFSLFYNNLTDEEKEILEAIISLCY